MLRRRQTRSELGIFIHNRYEDTSYLIFKDFNRLAEHKAKTHTAWQEIPDNSSKEFPGTSGLQAGKLIQQQGQKDELNRREIEISQENGVNEIGVLDPTKSTVCSIL